MVGRWIVVICLLGAVAGAQTLEPRFYSNAPVGLNFGLGGYIFSTGGLSVDPALALEDAELDVNSVFTAYARSMGLFGQTAKFDLVLPYVWLNGNAFLEGRAISRSTEGLGDPTFRFSYNFFGAPALTLPEFKEYRQDLVLGASLKLTAPLGQYDSDKALNIGQNRWAVMPELGVSKRIGRMLFEAAAGVSLYTDNDDFQGRRREQDPIYSIQAHVVYLFKSKIWIALDATRYVGGRTTVDGIESNDRIESSRIGATLAVPVSRRNSIKMYLSSGVETRTGSDFDTYGIAWQYRWGGGL